MKIIILRSKENLVWVSMNEIIPWIIRLWELWAGLRGHEVEVIDIDGKESQEIFPKLFKSDLVIITSFTTSMARLIYLAKGKLGFPLRCVFYLHNQATIACWPLFEWKMGEVLDSNDIFVGSCKRDKESMDLCFSNATTFVHPFSLDDYSTEVSNLSLSSLKHFVFIGRISPQKNLHTAIWAFYLLNKKHPELNWKFELYGEEDNYGSPLMGITNTGYKDSLLKQVKEFSLEDKIIFRGFMDRELIQSEMNSYQKIFFVPSLHSDENFGMAAFRSLSHGHKAILSDWGGHADYPNHFKDNVQLIPVRRTENGPVILAGDLLNAYEAAQTQGSSIKYNPSYYSKENILTLLDKLVSLPVTQGDRLKRTQIGQRIHLKRNACYEADQQNENKDSRFLGSRIFDDFTDSDSHALFSAYGMSAALPESTNKHLIPPWVKIQNNTILIDDPMKGKKEFVFKNSDEIDRFLYDNGLAINDLE